MVFACSRLEVRCFAYYGEKSDYSLIEDKVDGIVDDFADILPDGMESLLDPYNSVDAIGLRFLIENAFMTFEGESGKFISFLLSLFGMALLMALASLQEGESGRTCRNAVSLITSAIMLDRIFGIVESIGESLLEINAFFGSVIPIITAVNALGVSPGLASAQTVGMSFTLQIYSFFSGSLLYSLVGVMLIVSALSALDTGGIGRMAKSLKKAFVTIMGVLTAFIGATFSLQSVISSIADSGVIRGAKYAVSGMIPIVGNTISGALTTLISGVSYLRGIVGGGAIAVIISVALAPLVTLLLYRVCFNIVIFFLGICSQDGASEVFASFVSVLDSLIAVYSLTIVIYVVQLTAFLKGGASFA